MTNPNDKPSGEDKKPEAPVSKPARPSFNVPAQKANPANPANNNGNGKPPQGPDPKTLALGIGGAAAAAALLYFLTKQGGPGSGTLSNNDGYSSGPIDRVLNTVKRNGPKADDRVTFKDVAGIDEVKEDLQEVVALIQAQTTRKSLGGKAPKGALLHGGPGCGKTLIAKAIANEAGVNFVHRSGSDFVNKYVGVGPDNVRKMFSEARSKAPCVLFIDEIDALARHRSAGSGSDGAREYDNTTNAFLVEMDGMKSRDGIFVIGATNRLDMLDPAATRPGRFDRKVHVPLPDLKGREDILKVHVRDKVLASDFDPSVVARATPRFSGADLANLANEAALLAERQGKDAIEMVDFENAKDKIVMGSGRAMVMTEEDKRLTAYHEAGHALVALMEAASDPVHKATILPRGGALGMVVRLPEKDQYSMSVEQMKAHLSVGAAGRAAEELIFGGDKVTSGASGDIEQITNIASRMVKEWGLSSLGMINYAAKPEPGTGMRQVFSEATMVKIDSEIRAIVDTASQRAASILQTNRPALEAIANALLDKETLTGDELKVIAANAGAVLPTPVGQGAWTQTGKPVGSAPKTPKA